MPATNLYMMMDSPFDIAVLVIALGAALVSGFMRWPWWLPISIALFATALTQEGGDVNFWLIGFPVYTILTYADYATGRLIAAVLHARTPRHPQE
jgi:hypothetical protein